MEEQSGELWRRGRRCDCGEPEAAREDGFMRPWPVVEGLNGALLSDQKRTVIFLKVMAVPVIMLENKGNKEVGRKFWEKQLFLYY